MAVQSRTSTPPQPTPLRRSVTRRLLFLFILGDVLGAGIYALVGEIAGRVGGAVWMPLAAALVLALLTAGSYAELVGRFPRAGGASVYAQEAFGRPLLSFLVGFSMLAAGVTSAAGLALAFGGDYLGVLVEVPAVVAAIAFLSLVAGINVWGIKEGLRANVVFTAVEVAGLLVVVVLAAMVLGRGEGDLGRAMQVGGDGWPAAAILGAALLAFYSFVGFETSANLAEEAVDARRDYPRALFGALLTAGGLYVLVGLAVGVAVPTQQVAGSSAPLLEVVRAARSGIPDESFALIALVAVANGALLTMIMASRLTYGMAREGLLPRALGTVLPGRRTPVVAILATTGAAVLLALTGTVAALAETVVLLLLLVFISTNAALLVLRRREAAGSERYDGWRVWLPVPVLGIVSCLALLAQQQAGTWVRALLALAVGAVLYQTGRSAEAGPGQG
jgi:amino acid transporter